jgi:hypothetical protein
VVLRGRRRDRSGLSVRSSMSFLAGRRSRITTLTARRPLPQAKPVADYPQLDNSSIQPASGEDREVLLTSQALAEGARMYATPVYKRAVYLMSDAIVLTIASPFLAVWWIVRAVRRRRS